MFSLLRESRNVFCETRKWHKHNVRFALFRYGRPLLAPLHHLVVFRSKQFCVDICQRLLEQLVLFTERCEQPCERGGRVDGRLLGSGFWCRGPCQLYALGRVFAIRSGKEVWFGHAYSVFTSSPMGQSMHGSLQLLSPDIHREVCVLMRSVRMYFVRVHCHDVVFYWPSTLPFFGKVMPPSDI